MHKKNVTADGEIIPDFRTVRLFEIDGRQCRIFLTASGTIACEQQNPATGAWRHVPMRKASVTELFDMFVIRRSSPDEEIARALASY